MPRRGPPAVFALYIVGHDQLRLFLGDASRLGASPGLICSGLGAGFCLSTGMDSGFARSVVVAGMHPGRAGGPLSTSDNLASTAAIARSSQGRRSMLVGSMTVTVAVIPETSGMPGGTLSIAIRIGTRCARRTQVKTGSTFGNPCAPAAAFDTPMPRV